MKINSIKLYTNNKLLKNKFVKNSNTKNTNQQVSFQRNQAEHKSWGANYNPNANSASFKIFTYPDASSASIEVLKNGKYVDFPLENQGYGVFKGFASNISDGDKYHYKILLPDGKVNKVKDPYSFRQPELEGDSAIYDQSKYNWNDDYWFKNDKRRISRQANETNKLKPVSDLKIYEINIASVSNGSNFEAAKKAVKKAHQNGFNAIEIMPVENTYSYNWGYDGVDKFAASEYLGGPDKLKELIDYSHQLGINVIMDMVPNHLGPDGDKLSETGPYIKGKNDFGNSFNFENEHSAYVRDYIVNAALNWIDNFHCDGLRLDMTKYMDSDITMKQIATEVNYHKKDTFLIAEDARSNIETDGTNFWTNTEKLHDERIIFPLNDSDIGVDDDSHNKIIDNIMDASIAKLGYDSEWDFELFHSLNNYLFNHSDMERLVNAIYDSKNRVKYLMSHDEIGNCDGTRLISKLVAHKLNLNRYINLNDKDEQRIIDFANLKNISHNEARRIVTIQKAELTAEKLAVLLQTGKIHDDSDIYSLDIDKNSGITKETLNEAFDESFSLQKAAFALMYALPGPKMVFQGDDSGDLTSFRFFREFSDNSEQFNLTTEKGYESGESALKHSILGSIKYSNSACNLMKKHQNLTKTLNSISLKNPTINKTNTVNHNISNVLGLNIESDNDNIFVVTNFSNTKYPNQNADKYYINFPEGDWIEVLNTDSKVFGGNGLVNSTLISSRDGDNKLPINLPANSTIYFKKLH